MNDRGPDMPSDIMVEITQHSGLSTRHLEEAPARKVRWVEIWAAIVGLAAITATLSIVLRHGTTDGVFVPVLCLSFAIAAAAFDAATGRIPNPLTYTAILLGLFVNCVSLMVSRTTPAIAAHWLGAAGPTQSLYGLILFGGIGLIGVAFAGMGGGDMKLLAGIGAILGLSRATDALVCGAAVAVLYSLINLIIRGKLNATVRAATVGALNWLILKDHPIPEPPGVASRRTIPLAIPLLIGLVLAKVPAVGNAVGWLMSRG